MMTDQKDKELDPLLEAIYRHKKELGCKKSHKKLALDQKLINAILLAPDEVISHLLEQGANANLIHKNGYSMIDLAKALDRKSVIELLRSYGADDMATQKILYKRK